MRLVQSLDTDPAGQGEPQVTCRVRCHDGIGVVDREALELLEEARVCRSKLLESLVGIQALRLQARRRDRGAEGIGIQPRVVERSARRPRQAPVVASDESSHDSCSCRPQP